jgi:hypothetical protein
MSSLDFDKLLKKQDDREKIKEKTYKDIYNRCQKKIEMADSCNATHCTYEIPPFIFGLPLIDVSECANYIKSELNKKIYCEEIISGTLYINWDKKILEEKKKQNIKK